MQEQQNSSQEIELKTLVTKFAKERNYVLNKGLALYLVYGDIPEEEWEQPIPHWVEELPEGKAFTNL
jgi:hypothetical protein